MQCHYKLYYYVSPILIHYWLYSRGYVCVMLRLLSRWRKESTSSLPVSLSIAPVSISGDPLSLYSTNVPNTARNAAWNSSIAMGSTRFLALSMLHRCLRSLVRTALVPRRNGYESEWCDRDRTRGRRGTP